MSIFDQLIKLTKKLFPTGRAFRMPDNGIFRKFVEGYLPSLVEAYDNAMLIYSGLLPDNDDFTSADATFLEKRYGLISNPDTSLENRKAALRRKINHPGNVKARESLVYIEHQLQLAGFDVYLFENRFYGENLLISWDNGTFENLSYNIGPFVNNLEGYQDIYNNHASSVYPRTGIYAGMIISDSPGSAPYTFGGGYRTYEQISVKAGQTYVATAYILFEQSDEYLYIDDPDNLTYVQILLFNDTTPINDSTVEYQRFFGNATSYTKITATITPIEDFQMNLAVVKGCEAINAIYGVQKMYMDDISVVQKSPYTKTPAEVAISNISDVYQHGQIQHGQKQHGDRYDYKIANSLYNSVDASFSIGDNYKSTFFLSSSTLGLNAVIPQSRELELRQLILKLKPLQTVCFPFISFVPPVEVPFLLEDDTNFELEDDSNFELENSNE